MYNQWYLEIWEMIAQLELPIGTYSLRVNGQIQQAFALNEGQETMLRP